MYILVKYAINFGRLPLSRIMGIPKEICILVQIKDTINKLTKYNTCTQVSKTIY
jgi:hypothetical protein